MKLDDFLNKKNKASIDNLTYAEIIEYLQSDEENLISYSSARKLKNLLTDKAISKEEYDNALSLLKESIKTNRVFYACFIEAEDPTGKDKDYWGFYIEVR